LTLFLSNYRGKDEYIFINFEKDEKFKNTFSNIHNYYEIKIKG